MEVAKSSNPRPQGPGVTCWFWKPAARAWFSARTHVETPQNNRHSDSSTRRAPHSECDVDGRAIAQHRVWRVHERTRLFVRGPDVKRGCESACQTLGFFGLPGALVGAAARERRFRDDAMQQTVALVGSQADAFNEGTCVPRSASRAPPCMLFQKN